MLFGKKSKDKPAAAATSADPKAAAPSAAPARAPASPPTATEARPAPNGSAEGPPVDEARRRQIISRRFSLALGEIVAVLMRSKAHRQLSLAAVEQTVVPAVLTGQFSLAQARSKENGFTAPVAVALWASVSPEVDKRLSATTDPAVRLAPNEWKSGDILWLVEAVGDGRVVNALVKQLQSTVWKDRSVKMRVREEGSIRIKELPR